MTKLIECPTCQGEGKIYDRREGNRYDENDELKEGGCLDSVRTFQLTQKEQRETEWNGNKYLYDCKIPYDDSAKDLIKQLRKSGHKIRVRGSGERAKYSLKDTNGRTARCYDSHIPLKYASHVRLYITK